METAPGPPPTSVYDKRRRSRWRRRCQTRCGRGNVRRGRHDGPPRSGRRNPRASTRSRHLRHHAGQRHLPHGRRQHRADSSVGGDRQRFGESGAGSRSDRGAARSGLAGPVSQPPGRRPPVGWAPSRWSSRRRPSGWQGAAGPAATAPRPSSGPAAAATGTGSAGPAPAAAWSARSATAESTAAGPAAGAPAPPAAAVPGARPTPEPGRVDHPAVAHRGVLSLDGDAARTTCRPGDEACLRQARLRRPAATRQAAPRLSGPEPTSTISPRPPDPRCPAEAARITRVPRSPDSGGRPALDRRGRQRNDTTEAGPAATAGRRVVAWCLRSSPPD